MKVLYVTPNSYLSPYYDDVVGEIGELVSLSLYDFDLAPQDQFNGVDVVIEHGGQFSTPAMWDAAVRAGVRLWQVTATGLDHMNVGAFLERGIPLANMPGLSSTAVPMAEHAFTLMLAVAKRLQESRKALDARILFEPMTSELYGKTLGLLGAGASGREMARRASAFGMRILAVDVVEPPPDVRAEFGIEFLQGPEALDTLLSLSDYVSIHIPLTSATRNMLGRERIGLMKRGAVLINVARGALIDEDALLDALREGAVAGAGLDVFRDEPVDPRHPLLSLDNVVATPHNGVVSRELSARRAVAARQNIERIEAGLPPLHQIVVAP